MLPKHSPSVIKLKLYYIDRSYHFPPSLIDLVNILQTIQLEENNRDLQKQITTLNMRVGQLEEVNTSQQGQLTECLG